MLPKYTKRDRNDKLQYKNEKHVKPFPYIPSKKKGKSDGGLDLQNGCIYDDEINKKKTSKSRIENLVLCILTYIYIYKLALATGLIVNLDFP